MTDRLRQFLMMALGLAAIGTVCDLVPLTDENRIIVRHGLTSLKTNPCVGISTLLAATKRDQTPALTAEDLGFTIGPRLNATGRLGQAQLGVELLTSEDRPRVTALVDYIDQLNKSRDSLDRSIYLAATKQIKDRFDLEEDAAFVLADRGWHLGVIGIVAGRIAEKYHRPTLLISMDEMNSKPAVGSGRSVPALNLYEALRESREYLNTFGGHPAAAGFVMEDGKIDDFREAFCQYVAENVAPEFRQPELHVDVETTLGQLTIGAMNQINQLAPFGQSNPKPLFCASNVQLAEPPRRMGNGDRHLSLKLEQDSVRMRAVAFGRGDWAEHLDVSKPIDVAFQPVINEFRGMRNVELRLIDWRSSSSAVAIG